jgi:hypothetical protein
VTLRFPDVSQYTPNVDPALYPILIARATLSDRVADPTYATFKAKSAGAGTVFAAYHWLNHGNLAAQARWCFQHVGPDVPVMIDAEDVAGNTGYAGPLTVADVTGFAAQYRALGGIASLVYLPFWYWSGAMGAPHQLDQLTAAGLGLVSSNYPNAGYTDNGPGWATYYPGAPVPVQWQYTSTPIDMNAFKGTVADYAALIGMPQVAAESIEVDMFLGKRDDPNDGTIWLCSAMQSRELTDATQLRDLLYLHDTGVIQLAVGDNDTEWLPADSAHPRMIRNGYSPGVFGPVDTAPQAVQVDASAVAHSLAGNADFLAALAKAVNDDARTRRATWG